MVAEIFVFSLNWFEISNDNKCPTFVSTSERQSFRNWSKMPWAFNSLTSFSSKFGSSRSKSPGPTTRSCSILSCRESPKERTFSPSHGQLHNSQNYIWINLDHCKLQGARFVSLVHCVVSVLCSVPCCCGAEQLPQWRLSRTTRETLDGAAAAPRRVAEHGATGATQHVTTRPDPSVGSLLREQCTAPTFAWSSGWAAGRWLHEFHARTWMTTWYWGRSTSSS